MRATSTSQNDADEPESTKSQSSLRVTAKAWVSYIKKFMLVWIWISYLLSIITLYLSWDEVHTECFNNSCTVSSPLVNASLCIWDETEQYNWNKCSESASIFYSEAERYNVTQWDEYIRLAGCDWTAWQQQVDMEGTDTDEMDCYQDTEEQCLGISCFTLCYNGCYRHRYMFYLLCVLSTLTQLPLFKGDDKDKVRGCGKCKNDKTGCNCAVKFGKIARYFTSYVVRIVLIETGIYSSGGLGQMGLWMVAGLSILFACVYCVALCGCGCACPRMQLMEIFYVLVKSLVYIELFMIFILYLVFNEFLKFDLDLSVDFLFGFDFRIKLFTTVSVIAVTIQNILSILYSIMSLIKYQDDD